MSINPTLFGLLALLLLLSAQAETDVIGAEVLVGTQEQVRALFVRGGII